MIEQLHKSLTALTQMSLTRSVDRVVEPWTAWAFASIDRLYYSAVAQPALAGGAQGGSSPPQPMSGGHAICPDSLFFLVTP